MPGFNTRDFDDWDIFQRLMAGMSVVQPYVQFRGILYVDTMDQDRVTPAAEKILTWLFYFCGTDFIPNVTIVTTKWDGLDEDGIETKLTRFNKWKENALLRRFFHHGAGSYHHGLVGEEGNYRTLHIDRKADKRRSLAREMIAACYQGATGLRLQIHIDIANGATLETTQAGRWLKYGHAESAPPEDEASSSRSHHSGSAASDSEEDQHHHDNEARPNANPEPSATGGWGEQFFRFCEDPNRVKPWVELLFRAAKMYMKSSSSARGSFSHDDDFPEAFEGPDGFYFGFSSDDSDLDVFEEHGSSFGGTPPGSSQG